MREKGLDENGRALPPRERPQCSARARSGSLCKNKVIPGKRRCKFHGGLSTGPQTKAGKDKIAAAQRLRWERFRQASD
ncbi:HGGxSTG domain-containing protein [Roseinatronobacter domitianus]|uniref:HGGxSTG domain-containing protein n=1 Tax=Roseinatronobacter domitianus TaxID=2940293 RepID=UPI003D167E88